MDYNHLMTIGLKHIFSKKKKKLESLDEQSKDFKRFDNNLNEKIDEGFVSGKLENLDDQLNKL